jgi:hypothetical protein
MMKPTKLYNCEIVNPDDIAGKNLQNFLKQAQLTVIKVPVRQRGLTSSGGHLRCWWNVHALVAVWGGECLLGWHILPKTDFKWCGEHGRGEAIIHHQLFGHAIWINPEGRASCVTKVNLENLTKVEKNGGAIITEGKRQFILFAVGKITKQITELPKYNIGIKIDAPEIYIQGAGTKNRFEYKTMDLRVVDGRIQKHLIQRVHSAADEDIYTDAFSLPSKYTQKSFTELLKSKKQQAEENALTPSAVFNINERNHIASSAVAAPTSILEKINDVALSNSSQLKKQIELQSLMRKISMK